MSYPVTYMSPRFGHCSGLFGDLSVMAMRWPAYPTEDTTPAHYLVIISCGPWIDSWRAVCDDFGDLVVLPRPFNPYPGRAT